MMCEMVDLLFSSVLDRIEQQRAEVAAGDGRRLVVGLAGAVSVGKTTFATTAAQELQQRTNKTARIVGTDGFLLPNAVLTPRGRQLHKGFPDTYDTAGLQSFLVTAATAAPDAVVPTYSHEAFDTIGTQVFVFPDILLVEGINILGDAYAPLLDLRVYLDADEQVVINWFVARFLRLISEAESDPTSFYTRFVAMSSGERADTARGVWDSINGPNLHEHIAPTKDNADVVLCLQADHSVTSVEWRN